MSHLIEEYPEEAIIVATLNEDYTSQNEADVMREALIKALSEAPGPVYLIFNIQAKLGLDDLLSGSNRSARGEGSMLRSPNIKQIIAVTDSQMLKLAAQGMRAATFGNLDVRVFATLDEALAYARSAIKRDAV